MLGLIINNDSLPIILSDLSDILRKRIFQCREKGIIINSDSSAVICDSIDLSDEEFDAIIERMITCQKNGVSYGLVGKSCKKTSK